MKKKSILSVLVAILFVFLAACSQTSTDKQDNTGAEAVGTVEVKTDSLATPEKTNNTQTLTWGFTPKS